MPDIVPRNRPAAPRHLSAPAKRLFGDVLADYQLEAHHRAILVKSLEAWDRAETARRIVDTEGLVIETRLGEKKAHPATAIERDSRAAFLSGMRQLGLDVEPASARERTQAARGARWSA